MKFTDLVKQGHMLSLEEGMSLSTEANIFSKVLRKIDDKLFGYKDKSGDEILTFDIVMDKENEYDVDEYEHRLPFHKRFLDLLVKHGRRNGLVYEGPADKKTIMKIIDAAKESIDILKQYRKDIGKFKRSPYKVDSGYVEIRPGYEYRAISDYDVRVYDDVDRKTINEFYKYIKDYNHALNDLKLDLSVEAINKEKKKK